MVEVKPDRKFTDDLYGHYSNMWSEARTVWRDYDDYYWRRYTVWPDAPGMANRESFHPAKPAGIVDHAVDNQMAYFPTVNRPVYTDIGVEKERADRIEPWCVNLLIDSALKETVMTWKGLGKHLLHYGYGVVEGPLLDFQDQPDEPEEDHFESKDEFDIAKAIYAGAIENWNPYRIKAPHPARVLMDPLEKKPPYAIKTSRMLYKDLVNLSIKKMVMGREAQEVFIPDGKNDYDWTVVLDIWSQDWHTLKMLGGEIVFIEANTWGFVPFTHGFAGFGMEQSVMGRFNPKDLAVGLLHHIREGLKVQAQNYSAKHTLLINAAYSPMGTTGNAEEVAQRMAQGQIMEGDENFIWFVKAQQMSRWMFEVGAENDRDMEDGSYVSQLSGRRQPGVITVGQQQILSRQTEKKFVAPAQQMESMATLTTERALRLLEVLNRKVVIRGAPLEPKDVGHNYAVKVAFEVIDPAIELQRREQGMREVEMELISSETYRQDYARRPDETGERKRLHKDKLYRHPAVTEAGVRSVAEEEGLLETIVEYEKRLAEGGAGDEPTPSPNGAETVPPRQPLTSEETNRARTGAVAQETVR